MNEKHSLTIHLTDIEEVDGSEEAREVVAKELLQSLSRLAEEGKLEIQYMTYGYNMVNGQKIRLLVLAHKIKS